MPSFGTTVNPVSVTAFVLTCLGCVQTVTVIFITTWWSVSYSKTDRTFNGVWSSEACKNVGGGFSCHSVSATQLENGQEALFVSKVFATFTAVLSFVAVVLHVVYALTRVPIVRTTAIFMLGSAGLFGLLAVFVFAGFYSSLSVGSPSLGVAFYLFLIGSIVCLVAAAFTAWASVRKVMTFSPTQLE
ncbi:uncharacterized protein LOC131950387 [Physella acuta]|uniref:uncharacterized protein LOC131950387 n=1 Tax=Physella acuta TaxID=109671 RepID=UPI0027DDC7BF|nr:uncharacterized protein LOC131950387 [Physella acuta]